MYGRARLSARSDEEHGLAGPGIRAALRQSTLGIVLQDRGTFSAVRLVHDGNPR